MHSPSVTVRSLFEVRMHLKAGRSRDEAPFAFGGRGRRRFKELIGVIVRLMAAIE